MPEGRYITKETADRIKEGVERLFDGKVKALVLDDGVKINVLRQP